MATDQIYNDSMCLSLLFRSKRIKPTAIEIKLNTSQQMAPMAKFTILYTNHEGELINPNIRVVFTDKTKY